MHRSILWLIAGLLFVISGTAEAKLPNACKTRVPPITFDKQYNQIKHGPEWHCWPNGYWKSVGNWHQGRRHGMWLYWYPNGHWKSTLIYHNGIIRSIRKANQTAKTAKTASKTAPAVVFKPKSSPTRIFPFQVQAKTYSRKSINGAIITVNGKVVGRTNIFGIFRGVWKGQVGSIIKIKVIGPGANNWMFTSTRLRVKKTRKGKHPAPILVEAFLRER